MTLLPSQREGWQAARSIDWEALRAAATEAAARAYAPYSGCASARRARPPTAG